MPKEVPGSKSEATKAEGVQYTPEGFYPVDTANGLANIVRFKSSDGETFEITVPIGQRALNLQPDNLRERNYTPFSGRMRYLVGALAESLGLRKLINAAALSILLAACNDPDFSEKPRKAVAGHSMKNGELTMGQLSGNVKGKPLPASISKWGDEPGGISIMDGKYYFLIGNDWEDPNDVSYTECTELAACVDGSEPRQHIDGLVDDGLVGDFGKPVIVDENGEHQIYTGGGQWSYSGPQVYRGDIVKETDGNLVAFNMAPLVNPIGDPISVFYKDGVPYASYGAGNWPVSWVRNLETDEEVESNFPSYDITQCGGYTVSGDLAVGARAGKEIGGVTPCKLYMADDPEKLATAAAKPITGLNLQAPGIGQIKRLTSPQLFEDLDGSGLLTHAVLTEDSLEEETRIWTVDLDAPPDPVEPDPDATGSGDAGDPDAGAATGGETTDTLDAGTVPDTGPEILDTTVSEDPDTTEEPEVTAEDIADAIAQDVADAAEFLEDLGVDVAAIQDLLDQESDNQGDSPETEEDSDVPPVDAEKPDTETADDTQNPPDTTSGDTEISQDTKPSPDTTLPEQEPQPQPESSKDAGRTTASPHADATLSSPEAEKTAPESAGCIAGKTPAKSGQLGVIGFSLLVLVSTLRRKRR